MGKKAVTEGSIWDRVCAENQAAKKKAAKKKAKPKGKKKKKKGVPRAQLEEDKVDTSYAPVICKDCGEELYHLVDVVVKCPMGWKDLTKNGMRYKQVQVVGAKWEGSQWFCGCERPVVRRNRGKPKDNTTYRAGQRWTKGLVPYEPHKRTKNPARISRKKKNAEPD